MLLHIITLTWPLNYIHFICILILTLDILCKTSIVIKIDEWRGGPFLLVVWGLVTSQKINMIVSDMFNDDLVIS